MNEISETADGVDLLRRLEDRRYAVMVAGDTDALELLLDDGLVYMHSNGTSDSKATYLASLRSQRCVYHSVERSGYLCKVDGDTALVFGRLSFRLSLDGAPLAFESNALAVWLKRAGQWRLLAMHSGKVPSPAST